MLPGTAALLLLLLLIQASPAPALAPAGSPASESDDGPARLELLESAAAGSATASTFVHHRQGSYFGYSIAAYSDQGIPYAIVGAPLDYVSSWGGETPDDKRIGRAYRCEFRSAAGWSCERTPSASRWSNLADYRAIGHVEPGFRAGQWMGAAVAATSVDRDGYFSACAPRFVSKAGVGEAWSAIGECLVYPGLSYPYHVISPCNTSSAPASAVTDLGQCLSGFSTSLLGYKEGNDSILYFAAGLPGCHDSNGELYVGRFVNRNFTGGWTYRRQSGIEDLLAGKGRSLYLGQSVRLAELLRPAGGSAGGDGHSRRRRPPHLLASRSMWADANWKGAVSVMDVFMAGELHVKDTLGRVGDGFGYSLATGDLNGDGYSDIAIGAPYHSNSSASRVNAGRVYIFYGGGGDGLGSVSSRQVDGTYSVDPVPTVLEAADWKVGRFGHSVANVGDLDDDGLDDLAVGCPYCGPAGNGEVHVYLGRRGRPVSLKPHQVLRAESHLLDDGTVLKQFGWSISGGVDFDGNGYTDVLVGSHSSGAITLYKTRPAVRLSVDAGSLRAPALIDVRKCGGLAAATASDDCQIRLEGEFKLVCGSRVDLAGRQLEVEMQLDLDSRLAARKRLRSASSNATNSNGSSGIVLRRVSIACNKSFVFLEVADIVPTAVRADIVTQIVAQLRLTPAWQFSDWPPQSGKNASAMRPALHPASDTVTDFPQMQPLRPECGPDNVCRPRLGLQLQRSSLGDLDGDDTTGEGIVVYGGERGTRLRLKAIVTNDGEAAHEPLLRFRLPARVGVQWQTDDRAFADEISCSESAEDAVVRDRILACSLGRQLAPYGSPLVVTADLSLGDHLDAGGESNFTVQAEVTCQEAALTEAGEEAGGARSSASISFAIFSKAQLRLTAAVASRDVVIDTRTEAVPPLARRRYRLETLGAHFNHSYELFNAGPSPMHNIEVNLTVPIQTESGDTLVYLLDKLSLATAERQWELLAAGPRVLEATSDRPLTGAFCSYTQLLNPLNLTLWREAEIAMKGTPSTSSPPTPSGRQRRAVVASPSAEAKLEAAERQQQMKERSSLFGGGGSGSGRAPLEPVECAGRNSDAFGTIRCAVIQCRIPRINATEGARVVFDGLLWADTLFRFRVPEVQMRSSLAAVAVGPAPYGLSSLSQTPGSSEPPASASVEQFFFFRGVTARPAYRVPLVAVLVAVLVGLLLLAVIITCLYRCGFFQRRRWFVDKPVQL